MPPHEWDGGEEKARERRIAERRQRVQERLRLQHQQRSKSTGATSATPSQDVPPTSKCKQQALQSSETVLQLVRESQAAAESVMQAAKQRTEERLKACFVQEAAVRVEVAQEAEGSRQENREIDLEWERLQGITQPQHLHSAVQAVYDHCQQVLESKYVSLESIRALLRVREEQYVELLQKQSEETDALIALLHQQHDRLRAAQEQELESVDAANLQERREMLGGEKAELEVLLARRSAVEQDYMEQYLAACEQYEEELERMRTEGIKEHAALKRRLEAEVASLELHLDGIKVAHALNADKLDYNYRVLVEREHECKDALLQQKRRITRQWGALNRLRKRYAALDAGCAADNARLGDEYTQVARAFNQLQSKFRRFKAAELARFEQIRALKEEQACELLEQLLEAEHLMGSYVVGLPQHDHHLAPPAVAAEAGTPAGADGTSLGLELVGTAVQGGAHSSVAAAENIGPSEAMPELAPSAPASGAGQPGQLNTALYPAVADVAAANCRVESAEHSEFGGLPLQLGAAAAVELRASADSGALSLLLADSGQKLQALLAHLQAATPKGQLTAGTVARSLGLRMEGTVATLEWMFMCASGSALSSTLLGETVTRQHGATEGDAAAAAVEDTAPQAAQAATAAGPSLTFSVEQVERGLQRLMRFLRLEGAQSTAPHLSTEPSQAGISACSATTVCLNGELPTSEQYWQAMTDAMLPPAVVRSWGLLEQQVTAQFATLQSRTSTADKVLALRRENAALRATLADLLNSPLNTELQLPPTLLLH